MLMAAAVRAPTSVAIALFTLAVSAASLVNSPVVRLVSGSLVAHAARASVAISPSIALRLKRFMTCLFRSRSRHRLVVAGLHRVERPLRRLGLIHLDA